jgi:predicted chitinase
MSKKLVISEQEKKTIKNMYGLNEQDDMSFLQGLLKKAMELANKDKNSSSTEDSSDSTTSDTSDVDITDTGEIDLGNSGYDSTQKATIKLMIDAMKEEGITDPKAQIGVLSVIAKESGFKPKDEISYSSTSNSRIRSIFGKRVSKLSDSELDSVKRNPKQFFDLVYGGRFGNAKDEGYKYRGRGFNGLTFKGNYKKYGDMIGVDLVGNPDLANDPKVAAKLAVAFFTKGKSGDSLPKFQTKEEATKYFANVNSGGGSTFALDKALAASEKFDIKNLA